MAGARAVQVADLARHPETADALFQQLPQPGEQIPDAVDVRGACLRLRRKAQGCVPSAEACTGASGIFFRRSK
jgi:hypothetical protein